LAITSPTATAWPVTTATSVTVPATVLVTSRRSVASMVPLVLIVCVTDPAAALAVR